MEAVSTEESESPRTQRTQRKSTKDRTQSKMISSSLAIVFSVLAVAYSQEIASSIPGMARAFMGFPPSQFFQTVVLQTEAQKLLITPDFPEDLQQRVLNAMSSAETGFDNCNTVATLPWMQIRCTVLQLQKAKIELKAIEDEANARAQAAAAAAAAAAATPNTDVSTA